MLLVEDDGGEVRDERDNGESPQSSIRNLRERVERDREEQQHYDEVELPADIEEQERLDETGVDAAVEPSAEGEVGEHPEREWECDAPRAVAKVAAERRRLIAAEKEGRHEEEDRDGTMREEMDKVHREDFAMQG